MIPNLSQVDSGVWRGGQPDQLSDWQWLYDQGVRQIIKLNGDDEGKDEQIGDTLLFKCPIPVCQQLLGADLTVVEDAVKFIVPGTFVHCGSIKRTESPDSLEDDTQGGQDRTGLVIGLYRVLRCGWTKEAAYKEMLGHGFHPQLLGLLKAWEYLSGQWPVDPKPVIVI